MAGQSGLQLGEITAQLRNGEGMPTEVEIISKVLSNEATCRLLLNQLISRGVRVNIDPASLSHEEIIEVILAIRTEILRSERMNQTDVGRP